VLNVVSNVIHAAAGVTGADDFTWGIGVASVQVGSTVTLTNNTIGATGGQFARGMDFWNLPTSNTVTVNGGSVANSVVGVDLENVDPFFGAGSDSTVNVNNLAISGGSVGVRVSADTLATPPQSGANVVSGNMRANLSGLSITNETTGISVNAPTASSPYTASVQIGSGVTVSGGATGLQLNGADAQVIGDTLSNVAFSGQSGKYVLLSNGAEAGHEINATTASFAGSTGAGAGLDGNFAIEDKIQHEVDDLTLGFVRVTAGNVYVTTASGSIQRVSPRLRPATRSMWRPARLRKTLRSTRASPSRAPRLACSVPTSRAAPERPSSPRTAINRRSSMSPPPT